MSKTKAGKANEEVLNILHQLVAQSLVERISSGEATPQDINSAIKFLKDNDVTADISYSRPLNALETEVTKVEALPFVDDSEDDDEE